MMPLNGGYGLSLIESLGNLGDKWLSHCTDSVYGDSSLVAAGLKRYIDELCQLQQPDTKHLLFPCSFETYAFCIEEILRKLVALESEETIKVWTVLSVGLTRWYNLSLEDSENNAKDYLTYTRRDWEHYKTQVSAIARDQSDSANVQMRRIIAPYNESEVADLYVYDDNGQALKASAAKRKMEGQPTCLKILHEIQKTLESPSHNDALVHIVAQHDCPPGRCTAAKQHWIPLLEDFTGRFHSGVHRESEPIPGNNRGVYCGFVNTTFNNMRREYGTVSLYDDVFVVDVPSNLPFGLAFYRERRAHFSGMRILTQLELAEQKRMLEILWARA